MGKDNTRLNLNKILSIYFMTAFTVDKQMLSIALDLNHKPGFS